MSFPLLEGRLKWKGADFDGRMRGKEREMRIVNWFERGGVLRGELLLSLNAFIGSFSTVIV